jgi:branched-chain amino acid transport system substrate-binding protein
VLRIQGRGPVSKARIVALSGVWMLILAACGGAQSVGSTSTAAPVATTAGSPTTADTATTTAPPEESFGVFKVGALNPLTGPFTQFGVDVNAGFQHYVNEVRGGVLAGWEIEVIEEDSATDVDIANTKARKLVEQDQVNFMFGLVHSGVAYGVAPYINEAEIPFMITVAGADGLTQHDATPWIFRLNYTGSSETMPMGEYACETLGYETAVIVALDYAYGWESSGGFARTYEEAGCSIVQELYSPLATEDWAPVVQQIDTGASMVYAAVAGGDANRFVDSYRNFGVEVPLLGVGGLTDEYVLPQMGEAAAGVITGLHYSAALDSPENQEFLTAMEGIGVQPGIGSDSGWTAAIVLEAALEQLGADAIDPEALREALRTVSVTAPRGPVSFDDLQQGVFSVYVREVQQVDGQWVNAPIHTFEDVSQFWTYSQEEYLGFPKLADLKGTWAAS